METMVKQRWDQTVVPRDVALCVFAEAVLENDGTPWLGVRRGPNVESEAGGEGDGVVVWGGFGGEGRGGGSHSGVG